MEGNAPDGGVCHELEGLGFRDRTFRSNAQDRASCRLRLDLEKVMQTLQIILIGGILALAADLAVGPTAKFAVQPDCTKVQQCEELK